MGNGRRGNQDAVCCCPILRASLFTVLFAEVLNRAPSLILSNVNYVKKVVFPLEILPGIALGAALFHSFISLCVLLIAFVFANGFLHWTVILAPLVFLPLVILTLGLAWMLASLGVFLRDVGQTISILTMVMLFSVSHLLPCDGPSGGSSPLAYGQSPHFYHYGGTGCPHLGSIARLGGFRNLHDSLNVSCMGGLRLVPKNQERICRCPLTLSKAGPCIQGGRKIGGRGII